MDKLCYLILMEQLFSNFNAIINSSNKAHSNKTILNYYVLGR